jgi:hypothetical protein
MLQKKKEQKREEAGKEVFIECEKALKLRLHLDIKSKWLY